MRAHHAAWVAFAFQLGLGCGPSPRDNGPDCTGVCTALGFEQCHEDGTFDPPVLCGADEVCDPLHGCVVCVPDQLYCAGPQENDVYRCNSGGTGGSIVESCPMDNVCSGGQCKTPCQAAEDHPSNVGCEFWAADLDNEAVNINDAAAAAVLDRRRQQQRLPGDGHRHQECGARRSAAPGEPVLQVTVPPHLAQRLDLPQREVDGCDGAERQLRAQQRLGHVRVAARLPRHDQRPGRGLPVQPDHPAVLERRLDADPAPGARHRLHRRRATRPRTRAAIAGLPAQESIPDHGAVTIIPVEDDTHVTVIDLARDQGGGGRHRPADRDDAEGRHARSSRSAATWSRTSRARWRPAPSAQCASAVNGGQDGDFTGTYIKSDKPIVVFTSNERGAGFGGATNIVNPPGWDPNDGDDTCCTDHLEEQLFPVTALGKEFAIAHSPIRSTDPTWTEPDIIRVVGTVDGTVVTTNLPAPYDSFTLNARQDKTFGGDARLHDVRDQRDPGHELPRVAALREAGLHGDPSQLLHAGSRAVPQGLRVPRPGDVPDQLRRVLEAGRCAPDPRRSAAR